MDCSVVLRRFRRCSLLEPELEEWCGAEVPFGVWGWSGGVDDPLPCRVPLLLFPPLPPPPPLFALPSNWLLEDFLVREWWCLWCPLLALESCSRTERFDDEDEGSPPLLEREERWRAPDDEDMADTETNKKWRLSPQSTVPEERHLYFLRLPRPALLNYPRLFPQSRDHENESVCPQS